MQGSYLNEQPPIIEFACNSVHSFPAQMETESIWTAPSNIDRVLYTCTNYSNFVVPLIAIGQDALKE